jgi:uncharacterized delta-60 repeat protein
MPDGTPDSTFGREGVLALEAEENAIGGCEVSELVQTPSGGFLAVGTLGKGGLLGDLLVWRSDPTGTLRADFGDKGLAQFLDPYPTRRMYSGRDIFLDGAGRTLVIGWASGEPDSDTLVLALDSTGAPDPTFGAGGIVIHHDFAGGELRDWGVAGTTDSEGRILVVGHSNRGGLYHNMVVWRFTAGGEIDRGFGKKGRVAHPRGDGIWLSTTATDIILDASGRILVSGYGRPQRKKQEMVVWCLTPSGKIDKTFGNDGVVLGRKPAKYALRAGGESMTLDSEGRIVVAGHASGPNRSIMVVWRFGPDGQPDESFGERGLFTHLGSVEQKGTATGQAVTLDETGRILVAGGRGDPPGPHSTGGTVIWRIR